MVSENEISAKLGVSRTPVREALIELGKANIVEIFPQKGSRILLIDYSLVEESSFLRLVLENAILRIDCEAFESLDMGALEENVRLQEFYSDKRSPDKLMELDNEFHRGLFALANKMQCYRWMMDGMTIHFDRVRSMSLSTVKDTKIVGDHRAILEAIKAGKADEAVAVMTKHLSRYKVDREAIRAEYPDYFAR
jgi:DNA-binding GntR family transcriptional regulator